ncbi:hypothetical protein BTH42_32070 [Burkholderia sp. SRS-W-2-2016]|uniref:hypothetical protein n=1 Tax=Burkholderia sp. SRS-W-2-2016 TaxID=1926878 RepID=UPI00094ABA14|nr:hypothetical protein [Burkholderia sp. SRS-W-2-2016]OLL27482.1 hypothetical protein BTH42_32070 [Burkholderia sp. SRS-W-2-2016]
MNLGANVTHVREYMGWERTEFTYRFAPATLDNNDRKRCYDNLRSLEVRKQHTSELLVWLEPVLKISAATLQNDDLTRLTPDALVALRERYAGPSMDALTVVVNRCCDGVEPTPEEYQAAMQQADKVNKREDVSRLLKKIAVERNRWRRNATLQRVNHWRQV